MGMNMDMPSHEMELREEYEDGSQDWQCPVCGRRFILHWPPNYQREILNEGDADAVHTAGTGGLTMGDTRIEKEQPSSSTHLVDDLGFDSPPVDLDDPSLSPFKRFLDNSD
jgi:hypothetical protein